MSSLFDTTLKTDAAELLSAAQLLAEQCREAELGLSDNVHFPHAIPDARTSRAAGTILSTSSRIQSRMFQLAPAGFLQHLISQSQLLACIQWLSEFQILSYIPHTDNCSVPLKDLADLTDIPMAQLSRVIRTTVMAGFLNEPQPGEIAHTPLSAAFVIKPAHADVTTFLAETLLPSALRMADATRQTGHAANTGSTVVASGETARAFQNADMNPLQIGGQEGKLSPVATGNIRRLDRQWSTYLGYVGDNEEEVMELLGQLDWAGLGSAYVVDVGGSSRKAKSVVLALAERHRSLRFIVQVEEATTPNSLLTPANCGDSDTASRISIRTRASGTPQTIQDAAVYMVRLATPVVLKALPTRTRILAELRAHLGVLQANRSALLILTPRLLPEPGTVESQVEKMARLRDLSLLQLANDGEVGMQEVIDLVESVEDGHGRLAVVKKLFSRNSSRVVLGIRYQTHAERPLQWD